MSHKHDRSRSLRLETEPFHERHSQSERNKTENVGKIPMTVNHLVTPIRYIMKSSRIVGDRLHGFVNSRYGAWRPLLIVKEMFRHSCCNDHCMVDYCSQ
jgi:hypothetical protein